MTDEHQQKRRVLIAIVAVVTLIGAVGITLSLLVDDDTSTSGATSTPGATDPLTVEGQCRSEGVVKFGVTADPGAAPEFTATGAAERWVLKGEMSQTTSTGEDSKLIAIGKPGELPRVVLNADKGTAGWTIVETTGCLDPTTSGRACTAEYLTIGTTEYSRKADATESTTAGAYVGSGSLRSCPSLVGGQQLAARGVIAPVSAFAAVGTAKSVVITDDHGIKLFTR